MLDDRFLTRSISQILQRSERQTDIDKLVRSFVDVGILAELNNRNHQILYGRRGTGKTHVLRVLESQLNESSENITVYLDARTLGSTAQFSDSSISLPERCLALFRDILAPVRDALLEAIAETEGEKGEKAFDALQQLSDAISPQRVSYTPTAATATESVALTAGGSVKLGFTDPAASLNASRDSSESLSVNYSVASEKVVFPALHDSLSEILRHTGGELYLLIDEWSSLPRDIQPYLAEFLKRGLLPIAGATVKIAALEYRSTFEDKTKKVGFELGADISASLHLDDYFVFDRNSEQVTDEFSNMIFQHLAIELGEEYMTKTLHVTDGKSLQSRLFTESRTFGELARASEGVVRDLINIFSAAYFDAKRRTRSSIDRKAVTTAAQQWFERDKAPSLGPAMERLLRGIVDEVIGHRRARSFMLPRELQAHRLIQALFDGRVLHLMHRGYADKVNPGLRYDIYTLDYGTYVDLIGTSNQPEFALADEDCAEDEALRVPIDDKRSIRRIVLDKEFLARFEIDED